MIRIVFTMLLMCGSLFLTNLEAQTQLDPCGTTMSEAQMDWLRDFKKNPPANFKVKTSGDETYYIPIQFHILGDDNGDGYYSKNDLLQLMCDLNNDFRFTDTGMQFFIHNNELEYHDNTIVYSDPDFQTNSFQVSNFYDQNNVYGAINVYVVDDPAGNCGYFTPSEDNIAIAKNCAEEGDKTFAHEIGHYFSLNHTFFRWEYYDDEPPEDLQENVARTGPDANCYETADLFCDTPADYADYRWNCPFNGEFEDPTGATFTPDSSFMMSYSSDGCKNRFSDEQIEAMQANLLIQRSYLLNSSQTLSFADINPTQINYPASGESIPNEDIELQWEEIEGATGYSLHIYNVQANFEYDEFVTSNTFVVDADDLQTNKNYWWSVRPFNDGDFCLPFVLGSFKLIDSLSLSPDVLEVTQPSCTGASNGSINISVKGGEGPYTYTWEDGTEGPVLENLDAGNYRVTVLDEGTNTSETIKVKLYDPEELEGTATQQEEGKFEIDVDGGTVPYTITWPNGEVGNQASDLEPGTQTITVEDGGGCILEVELEVVGLDVAVYTPSCIGDDNGSIQVQEVLGGTPPYYYFSQGETLEEPIIIGEQGTYEMEVRDSLGNGGVFSFEIQDPEELGVSTTNLGEELEAVITGGTPPYLVKWFLDENDLSNVIYGTGLELEGIPTGVYTGLVSDAGSCSESFSFVVQQQEIVDDTISGIVDLKLGTVALFPNPVPQSTDFYLEFNINQEANVDLNIFNSLGQKTLIESRWLATGNNKWSISTEKWSKGVYFVLINIGSEEPVIQKIVVE